MVIFISIAANLQLCNFFDALFGRLWDNSQFCSGKRFAEYDEYLVYLPKGGL